MKKALFVFLIIIFIFPNSVNAGQGCCSWHGGQDYCSGGKWVCSDGWTSSCSCGSYNSYSDTDYDDNDNANIWNIILILGISFCIWPGSLFIYGYFDDKNKKK